MSRLNRGSLIEVEEIIDPLGNRFVLKDGRNKFVLSEFGEGQPPIEYLTTSGPFQDGETVRDYRLRPRILILGIRWQGCDRDGYWSRRAELLNILRPNRQTIGQVDPYRFRRRFNDRSIRDLYVMPSTGPGFTARDPGRWDERGFAETIQLIAHDPTWYDPTDYSIVFTDVSSAELVFPIEFPILFSSGVINTSMALTYGGTWPAFPTIEIIGPATNPVIENTTTGERLEITYTLAALEVVTFDLAYGVKSITNGAGTSLIGNLSTDSDLATFHLEPPPGAVGGVNNIYVLATGTDATTQITVRWHNRYTGI